MCTPTTSLLCLLGMLFLEGQTSVQHGRGYQCVWCVCMLHVVVHSCRMFVWSILPLRTKEKLRRQDDKMSRIRKRTVRETCIACVFVISDDFKSNQSFINYFLYLRCCCSSNSVNRAAILTYYSNESWSLCSPAAQMSINSY